MKFISYAQNFEDVMLRRALKRVKNGFYVDVGAQDPVRDSVSKAFYETGWHGINIEPVPFWFDKLSADRPRDINLRVAASSSNGEMTLYEVKNSGLSTTDVDYAKHYSRAGMQVMEHSIQTRTLTSILADADIQEIHFLKVDVEGAEENVLRGMDFGKYRPWIILVEARLPNSTRDAFRGWESIIVSAGYTFAWDDGLNRFYYANEHSRLAKSFRFPPNVFDQFIRYSESQSNEALQEVQTSQTAVVADRDGLVRWAHELEAKLAQAEASIATQAGLTAQLETQHRDLLNLDAALQEAQASQSAMVADREELARWAHELEAKLAQAEASIATQAGLTEQLETQHQDLLNLDAALREARASQSAVVADREELVRWAHELEAKLAQAEASIATQAGLAAQLETQHQDLLNLDAALREAQASRSAVVADRDELVRWAHELEAKLAQAEASMYESNLQLAGAFEQLGQIEDERRVVDTEVLRLHAQVTNLLARVEHASHANARDAEIIAGLNGEIARLKEQHAGLQEQSKDLRSRYEEALSDNDHLRRTRLDLVEEVSQKAQEIALTEREVAAVGQLLAARIAEIERLHQSRSWRMTSPLRRVSGLLGAFRRHGVSGTMRLIASRHSSRAGHEKTDSCADDKNSHPTTAPSIQDVLSDKHIEALEGVRRKIRQRLDDKDKGR